MKAYLIRNQDDGKQTLGHFFLFNGVNMLFKCVTLEPPWRNNQPQISCIPAGVYTLKPFESPTFGACLSVDPVSGRDLIRMHGGNFFVNTKGCILPGKDFEDLNKDGFLDVTFSKGTLGNLLQFVQKEIPIVVIGV